MAVQELEKISGVISTIFYSCPTFTAGKIRTSESEVTFAGKLFIKAGEMVSLVGSWTMDKKYGRQFKVKNIDYDLPESTEGLIQYLAASPAFKGVGFTFATKIVNYAASRENLGRILKENPDELQKLSIPVTVIQNLAEGWEKNQDDINVRSYLSGYELTQHQIDVLLDRFGSSVIGILQDDPYKIIEYVNGYGFVKVDKIARKLGVAKNHPGRIRAGILYCLSEAINDGHTCINANDLINTANNKLMLDGLDSLKLIRAEATGLFNEEKIKANGEHISTPSVYDDEILIRETLVKYGWRKDGELITPPANLNNCQSQAFFNSMRYRISCISGGAGTGKSYTIGSLARSLQGDGADVVLCAPTGKAAKRMEEVMCTKYSLDLEACTIHRLLGYNGHEYTESQVSADVIIVDEVSMVDVPLMARLFERIDFDNTKLVLVGDHNQLPPVGPGNVLRDLIAHDYIPTTILDEVVRQAGILKVNSLEVLEGKIKPSDMETNSWTVIDNFTEVTDIQLYVRDLVLEKIPQRFGYDPLTEVQLITPMHKGSIGTKDLNKMMQYTLRGKTERRFAVGDKVIQTVNDYNLNIMNGHIGFVKDIFKDGMAISFEGEFEREITNEQAKNLDLAYALTAHKAQGSEFPCVVVLCHKSHYFADRNWLYTAVTRAAKTCIVVGDRWGLRNAAKKNKVESRQTWLSVLKRER